jgi:hypothetical protein
MKNQFHTIEQLNTSAATINSLIRLGIRIVDGMPELYDGNLNYCYQALMDDIKKDPFSFGNPSAKQICTLALAIHQEDQNEFIEPEKIAFVNTIFCSYFDKPITYKEVQDFNSKYL